MLVIRILAIVAAVGWLAAAGAGWLLKGSYERNGKLENANTALTKQLDEARNAARNRATIDRDTRSLPDDQLFDRLR